MNIQGGGLSFEISGSNDKLLSVLNESKKAIQNFSTAAISGGKGIDRAFENAAAAIEKGFSIHNKDIRKSPAAHNGKTHTPAFSHRKGRKYFPAPPGWRYCQKSVG